MSKFEGAFYSLKAIGCSPHKLHPHAVGFIYKQFCQSILMFGFEFVYLRSSFVDQLNVRQNLLLKNVIGVKHRARFKPLINEIKVDPVGLVYGKHKVFGWQQCIKNQITDKIFNFLYNPKNLCNNVYNNFSFIRQVSEAIGAIEMNPINVYTIIKSLASNYECNDLDMKEQVSSTLRAYHDNPYACVKHLNDILKIVF